VELLFYKCGVHIFVIIDQFRDTPLDFIQVKIYYKIQHDISDILQLLTVPNSRDLSIKLTCVSHLTRLILLSAFESNFFILELTF